MELMSLVDELDNMMQRARRVPGNKVLLDEGALRQVLDEMRSALQDEERHRQRLVAERDRMLSDARAQAQRLLEGSQAEVKARVEEHALVTEARERARQIVVEAEQRAAKLHNEANQYTASQLASLENRLMRVLREVQAGQQFLAQEQTDPHEVQGKSQR